MTSLMLCSRTTRESVSGCRTSPSTRITFSTSTICESARACGARSMSTGRSPCSTRMRATCEPTRPAPMTRTAIGRMLRQKKAESARSPLRSLPGNYCFFSLDPLPAGWPVPPGLGSAARSGEETEGVVEPEDEPLVPVPPDAEDSVGEPLLLLSLEVEPAADEPDFSLEDLSLEAPAADEE